jgi:hypothetical protein
MRTSIKTVVGVFLLLVSAVANSSLAAEVDDLFGQLKVGLPPGWTVTQTEAGVTIRGRTPLTLYNPISLPPPPQHDIFIEKQKYQHDYSLTMICKPDIPLKELNRQERENAKTDEEIQNMEDKMREFSGKGSYQPKTPKQKELYQDYKTKLETLPYHVLPDGRFGNSLVYVESSFPKGHVMFYDVRGKYDCLSAISVILSVVEPVKPHSLRFDSDEKQASEILWARRPWEVHERRVESNRDR